MVSVTALRDDQGTVIGYLLIGTDNTARKQAEEALLKAVRDKREELRVALDKAKEMKAAEKILDSESVLQKVEARGRWCLYRYSGYMTTDR